MLYTINSKFEATIQLNNNEVINIENKNTFDLIYILDVHYNVKITKLVINHLNNLDDSIVKKALNNKDSRFEILSALEDISNGK